MGVLRSPKTLRGEIIEEQQNPALLPSHLKGWSHLCRIPAPVLLLPRVFTDGMLLFLLLSHSLHPENSSINPNCCNNLWEAFNLVVIDLNNANINE